MLRILSQLLHKSKRAIFSEVAALEDAGYNAAEIRSILKAVKDRKLKSADIRAVKGLLHAAQTEIKRLKKQLNQNAGDRTAPDDAVSILDELNSDAQFASDGPSMLEKGISQLKPEDAARRLANWLSPPPNQLDARRLELSAMLNRLFNSTVAYGPLKGLRFSPESWYGQIDRGSMLLGLYEQEVQTALTSVPETHRTFIDLGAADGYYGVGVLVNNLFDDSYCFEISEKGQSVIRAHAILNGVSEKVSIFGIAEKNFYDQLPQEKLSRSVLLVDIEGAEFDLFNEETFERFQHAIIIVELHDFVFPNGDDKLQRFLKQASCYFTTTMLTTSERDPSLFPVLSLLSDNDRWLLCSESRPRLMRWCRLDPKDLATPSVAML